MDRLEVMVRLIEEISKFKAPIVFKGAIVREIAVSCVNLGTSRFVPGILGDWVGNAPTMEQLSNGVAMSLKKIDSELALVPFRYLTPETPAGFTIGTNQGVELFKLDIWAMQNPFRFQYKTPSGVQFVGESPHKMVADKIFRLSMHVSHHSSRDLYDLFLWSHLKSYKVSEIAKIYTMMGVQLGPFHEFLHRLRRSERVYWNDPMIINKPDFVYVYQRVYHFLEPFIMCVQGDMQWNSQDWVAI